VSAMGAVALTPQRQTFYAVLRPLLDAIVDLG
jgi:hypothetical protein